MKKFNLNLSFFNKINKAWRGYVIYTGVLLILALVLLIYIGCLVGEYDKAQPERVVENIIENIEKKLSDGSIDEYIGISESFCEYEASDKNSYVESYINSIKDVTFTYSLDTGAGEGLEKVYTLLANDKKFAKVYLSGSNSRSKLFFFSMADWTATDICAMPIGGGIGDMKIYLPQSIHCSLNGIKLSQNNLAENGDIPVYIVKNLTKTPTIKFERDNGAPVSHTVSGTTVTPAVYNYSLSLSPDITVKLGEDKLEGVKEENGSITYQILSMTEPSITISDLFGNSHVYNPNTDIPLKRFTLQIPENFVLKAGDIEISKDNAEKGENPDKKELAKYVDGIEIPDLLTYKIFSLSDKAEVSITDNLGKTSNYLLSETNLVITGQSGSDEVPGEILAEIDPMVFAESWSKFLTNDLGATKRNGFNIISNYFLKDSTYYKEAYGWITNIDSTFTSAHRAPTFSDKKLTDFISYGDGCFSVRASLVKSMYLIRTGETVYDPLDLILYFVKYDSTPDNNKDDAKWIVAVKHDAQQGE